MIVQGVSGSADALGYFGFTYYEENADKLKAVEIDSGNGCVAPSAEAAQDGTYSPLARPLFIYVSNSAAKEKPQVAGVRRLLRRRTTARSPKPPSSSLSTRSKASELDKGRRARRLTQPHVSPVRVGRGDPPP